MAEVDSKYLSENGLSIYDALIKHYISLQHPKVSSDQIDDLFINLVSFSTGSDEEIVEMINNYYNNKITLEEIQSVWHVGDTREINLSAIAASGGSGSDAWTVGESHRAQIITIEIIDFVHDDLVESINGKTKALLTVDLKYCLSENDSKEFDSYDSEFGYMKSEYSNYGGWKYCARRNWCNNGFYNALPNSIKNLIKPVIKLTSVGNKQSTIDTTADYIFLLSEIEYCGFISNSFSGEGTQYTYYNNIDNRNGIKCNYYHWWLRSPCYFHLELFCSINAGGAPDASGTGDNCGIAPAFCL